ncbi:hypothetical protein U879_11820 [Defluviimonas sp. 20V17]|uniref:Anti-sigma-28 factor, FlgM n=1 Tax=Allgaiera indica TaxID=765699 RepID=A0AAN4UMG6_9RHOB|nr:flagellar biosynthesis anti-sigma factor FlgM [Allgaiera indica]KDB03499.1 hypothetical protein U879_11820 [Defluviimonas sp. 20V17]GHD98096.1 hypothetical protein GCM10008024_00240 [Allgaiera indica]SDW54007.1 Anti-sigma-28 factor, FlgM [Allgaiera indica]
MVKISGISNGTLPVDQPKPGTTQAADRAQPGSAPTTASQVQGGEVVSLSGQAQDAAALLKGVAAADQPHEDARVQQLASQVATGSYRPPAARIAGAIQSFERLLARKLGRD